MEKVRLTMAMLTYQRNSYLEAVLPLLVAQAQDVAPQVQARVLIVDNDPQGRARAVVAAALESPAVPIVYVHEPEPGIVAGRNRALDESANSDLLAFIDDDEVPEPGWLAALVRTWRQRGCAAVTGPTPPTYEVEPNRWVRASGAFDSWDAPDGAQVRSADTGNLLLDLSVVRKMNLRFDPRYGLTGGEDSLFTRQLTLGGGKIHFAADAVVTKRVPATRAQRSWVLQRAYRSGSSWARVRIETTTGSRFALRLAYATKGAAKAGIDGARAVMARARGDVRAQAAHETSSRGGLGMVVGAWGVQVREYARPKTRAARNAETRAAQAGSEVGSASEPEYDAHSARSLTIAIPTFQRPESLARAITGVLAQAAPVAQDTVLEVEILVIDNDPAGSARPVATSFAQAEPAQGVGLRYVVEPRPGVAAVRNRALDETAARDLLIFIDDDEAPEPGWLSALLSLQAAEGCQAVAGPVIPEYESKPDAWVTQGAFFVRKTWPTGTVRPVAASNCLLLDLRFVRRVGLRFDESFGATGGEDTLFTRQLTASGGRILWCDEARVRDYVPTARLDHAWILRRQRSHATTSVRVDLTLAQTQGASQAPIRLKAVVGGVARVGIGSLRTLGGKILDSPRHAAKGARLSARGQGMLAASIGRGIHQEYGRVPELGTTSE